MKKAETAHIDSIYINRACLHLANPDFFIWELVKGFKNKPSLKDLSRVVLKNRSVQIRVDLWLKKLILIIEPGYGQA